MTVVKVLAPGIYEMVNGSYRVVARVGDRKTGPRPKEKRFPKGTALKKMKAWQEDARAELRRQDLRPAKGTLAADIPVYLKAVEGQLEHPTNRKYEIEAWSPAFGGRRRDTIKGREVEVQVRLWQSADVAASRIRHRLSALSHLYKVLDGRGAYNPVGFVERPAEPKPGANAQPLESVVRIFDALTARTKQNNRGWKTLARLRVIAATGMRHSQVMRLPPSDIWLDHDPPIVIVNQAGKGGRARWKPLTSEGVASFKLFIQKAAFGDFSQSSVYKSWKLACEDAGVPFFNPYRLRHTYATTLRAGGMDLADVQELVGHTSSKTTARYAMVSPQKLFAAVGALNQGWDRARTNVERDRVESKPRGTAAWQSADSEENTGKTGTE